MAVRSFVLPILSVFSPVNGTGRRLLPVLRSGHAAMGSEHRRRDYDAAGVAVAVMIRWLGIVQIIIGLVALICVPGNQGLHVLVVVAGFLLAVKG